jgi:hypothetical protein
MTNKRIKPEDHGAICDFCGVPVPAWSYSAQTFRVADVLCQGSWLACDECAQLIETSEWGKLAERALRLDQRASLAVVMYVHREFDRHRIGSVTRLAAA